MVRKSETTKRRSSDSGGSGSGEEMRIVAGCDEEMQGLKYIFLCWLDMSSWHIFAWCRFN